jgi:hypothetical protein
MRNFGAMPANYEAVEMYASECYVMHINGSLLRMVIILHLSSLCVRKLSHEFLGWTWETEYENICDGANDPFVL